MPPVPQARPSVVPLQLRIERLYLIATVLAIEPPAEWILGSAEEGGSTTNEREDCLECTDYKTLNISWRKALRWTDGLDRTLSAMLASIASTMSTGNDQLWLKVMGPPSCGKSTLCEAVSMSRKYVLPKSSIRGFYSGYKSDAKGKEDNSLVVKVNGKTLVTKDGDTLLQTPNLGQILSEARDLYDGASRTHYRNKMGRSYEGIRMTWILCGTASLRVLDQSELGARFLDCVVMEGIDDEAEDEVLERVAAREAMKVTCHADENSKVQLDPKTLHAYRLTGGYVNYLRTNAQELLSQLEVDETHLHRCTRLGKFVAFMRARPSTKQSEEAEREFAPRLVAQAVRLMMCLSIVLNRKTPDEEVMRRVTAVMLETARGHVLKLTSLMAKAGSEGMSAAGLATWTNRTENDTRAMLRFLKQIQIAEPYNRPKTTSDRVNPVRWKLTLPMARLHDVVYSYTGNGAH